KHSQLIGPHLIPELEIARWLNRELTNQKVRGSNPTSASRLPLSGLGQPDSIPALVLPLGCMAVRHRKGVTAERLFILSFQMTLISLDVTASCQTQAYCSLAHNFNSTGSDYLTLSPCLLLHQCAPFSVHSPVTYLSVPVILAQF
ncbi:hypothetical protein CSKR_109713, partial [Clonorchis sinensis]